MVWSPKTKAKRNLMNDFIWQKNTFKLLTLIFFILLTEFRATLFTSFWDTLLFKFIFLLNRPFCSNDQNVRKAGGDRPIFSKSVYSVYGYVLFFIQNSSFKYQQHFCCHKLELLVLHWTQKNELQIASDLICGPNFKLFCTYGRIIPQKLNPYWHLQKAQSSPNFNPFQTKIELPTLQNFKPTGFDPTQTTCILHNNKFFVSIKFSCQSIFTMANMSNINAHFSNTKYRYYVVNFE